MAVRAEKGKAGLQEEIDKYKKALKEDPNSRLFAALADSLRRAGETRNAIRVAEDGLQKHPKYLSGLVVLAQACHEDEQLDKAVELFEKVVHMNPENIVAQRALADLYDRKGDHDSALRAYRALSILDPTDMRAKNRLDILEATSPRVEESTPSVTEQEPDKEKDDAEKTGVQSGEKTDGEIGPHEEDAETEKNMETDAGPQEADGEPMTVEAPRPEDEGPDTEDDDNSEERRLFDDEKMDGGEDLENPAEPETSAAKRPGLEVEQKLDLFFQGAAAKNIRTGDQPEVEVGETQADAGDADELADGSEEGPEDGGDVPIKTCKMARLFWEQGFYNKALEVMAEEIKANPRDKDLYFEFARACEQKNLDPEEIIYKTILEKGESAGEDGVENISTPPGTDSSEDDGAADNGDDAAAAEGDVPAGAGGQAAGEDDFFVPSSRVRAEAPVEMKGDHAPEDEKSDVPDAGKLSVLKSFVSRMKTGEEGER